MEDKNTRTTTVEVVVGRTSRGTPAHEEVLVEPRGGQRYRLLRSPGLATNLAAEDLFLLKPDGTYDVLSRGGNICIQVYSLDSISEIEAFIGSKLGSLGGRLDGQTDKLLVFTIAAAAGFEAIERELTELAAAFPNSEWYFGNVYDPIDGVTPLNWWK